MDNHTSYNVYHLSTGDLDFAGPSTVSTAGSKPSKHAMVIPAHLMIFKDGQSLRWYGRYPRGLTACELEHGHRNS